MSSIEFQKRVALKIKSVRRERGYLQKDFSKFGYSLRHYQKIESGRANLTLKTLFKLARVLNVDVTELIGESRDDSHLYKAVFHESPVGVIIWRLTERSKPDSLELYDHNRYGARAVFRDLANSIGKPMLEIFPKAREQGLIDIFFEVITKGKSRFVPEVVRYDESFPFTVFSTRFIKCGPALGAALFVDSTSEYLKKQEIERQRLSILQLKKEMEDGLLPPGHLDLGEKF